MTRNIRIIGPLSPAVPKKKRVAAYARVSSGKDAMLHSLSAQVSYYSDYIQRQPGWEYTGVYADEALTGTKDARPEFQRLLADCRTGKIDMVITKSISRLARNTVTMLEAVRELKAQNIDVFFEKEGIHSLSGDGELMLTILASFSQEESRSVSENCKWRIRRQFAQGRPGSMTMLGYKQVDGAFEIIPEEAASVRMIFNDYLSGMSKIAIAANLNNMGIQTKRGGIWHESMVKYLLCNEKYAGDMLLQKTFVSDHIKKKRRINQGELPKFFVAGSHASIICKETFARVQDEMARRAEQYHPVEQQLKEYPFTGMLICGHCGKHYRHKISNAGSKYASAVWICSTFNKLGKMNCPSKQIPEDILLSLSAQVLGRSTFDEAAFNEQIQEIRISGPNKVIFVFRDGHTAERVWQNKSRRDSWSAEAKQRARQHQLEHLERKNGQCEQTLQK